MGFMQLGGHNNIYMGKKNTWLASHGNSDNGVLLRLNWFILRGRLSWGSYKAAVQKLFPFCT